MTKTVKEKERAKEINALLEAKNASQAFVSELQEKRNKKLEAKLHASNQKLRENQI